MKKTKILIVLLLLLSLLFAACNGAKCESICPDCGKCNDTVCNGEKCTCADEQPDSLCTLSGLTGENYSFQAEDYSITSDGKLQVPVGTKLKVKLVLGEGYFSGEPVVRLNGEVLTPEGDTYTLTVNGDGNLTLEGAWFYQLIGSSPFSLESADTVAEVATPISEASGVINAQWQAEGYSFVNTRLAPYYSVMFYIRADNAWFTLRDNLGQFNEKNTAIYANGVKNEASGEMEPDSVWHKIEFIRETDEEGNVCYGLYVDGQKHTHYDEKTPVDARLQNNLSDLLLDLNGTYYVSELFGCLDPVYAVEYADYYIAEQEVFALEADGLLTDDYPCEESVRYNLYYKPEWSQERPINFPMEPYLSAKFYINSIGTGYVVCLADGEQVHNGIPGTGWHEYMVKSNGTDYDLYVDGKSTGKTVRSNLRELVFLLNDSTYCVSELFVTDDPGFDGVIDEPYFQEPAAPDLYGTGRLPAGTVSIRNNPFTLSGTPGRNPFTGFEASSRLDTTWNKYNFQNVELEPYQSVMFAVKTTGWYGVMVGDKVISEMQGTGGWRIVRLTRMRGNLWKLYYGATPIQTVTLPNNNLADLNFRFGDNTYYVTDLRGLEDPNYVPPQYVNVTNGDPLNLGAVASEEMPDRYFVTGSYQLTPEQWCRGVFASVDVLAYKDLRLYVKAAGLPDKWVDVAKGDFQLMGACDDVWHEIRLKKADGKMEVYVDGGLKTFVNNMSQIAVAFNENATYYYTDIYGLVDETYAPVTVTVTAPAGCTVEFRQHQVNGNTLKVENGTALYFELKLDAAYGGTPVVKANGETLTDVYGLYTYVVEGDTEITIEGIVDPYEMVSKSIFTLSGTASSEAIPGYDTVTAYTTSWNMYNFNNIDLTPYLRVKFVVKSVTGSFGIMPDSGSVINESRGAVEIGLVRNGDIWEVHYNGVKQQDVELPNNNLTDLNFRFNTDTYYVTELRGIVDPDYEDPYSVVSESVFTLSGTASSEVIPGYDTVTAYTTSWNMYNFNNIDLAPYLRVKFVVQSVNGSFGIMPNSSSVINESRGLVEIELVRNGDVWEVHYNGVKQQDVELPNNNLTDLNFRFNTDTYYVTELRGIEDPNYDPSVPDVPAVEYVQVAENLLAMAPTSTATTNLPAGASVVNAYACGWSPTSVLEGVELAKYTELKFYVKTNDANKSFEMHDASGMYFETKSADWQEIVLKYEQPSENVTCWTLYVNGQWTKGYMNGKTLADIVTKVVLGGGATATVYITDLLGVEDPNYDPSGPDAPGSAYVQVAKNLLAMAPTSTDTTARPAGAGVVNAYTCGWSPTSVLEGVELAKYTELKFYVKTNDANKSFEMHDASGMYFETKSADWQEIVLKYEQPSENVTCWTLYVNGAWTKGYMNGETLADIVTKVVLGGGATATVYITDLLGVEDPNYDPSGPDVPASGYVRVTANLINTTPASTTTEGLPSRDVNVANIISGGWASPGVVDGITMADYTELKFWYRVSNENKSFEMYDSIGAAYGNGHEIYTGSATAWTEMKFVWEAENSVWTLYVNDVWTRSGLTGTTLKDIVRTLTLGGSVAADVYVTELIGKPV